MRASKQKSAQSLGVGEPRRANGEENRLVRSEYSAIGDCCFSLLPRHRSRCSGTTIGNGCGGWTAVIRGVSKDHAEDHLVDVQWMVSWKPLNRATMRLNQRTTPKAR